MIRAHPTNTRFARHRRSIGGIVASLVVGVALVECGEESATSVAGSTQDLIAGLHDAEVWEDVAFLGLVDQHAGQHLASGWAYPMAEQGGEPARGRWTDDATAELRFHFGMIAARTLTLRARAESHSDLVGGVPGAAVSLFWNGAPLGEQSWGAELSDRILQLPARLQHLGANRLTLRLPAVDGVVARLFVESVRLSLEDVDAESVVKRSRRAVPGGALADRDARGMLQGVGTHVVHHLSIPAGARLSGATRGPDLPRDGPHFRVRLTSDEGAERILWEGAAGTSFDVPFGVDAGRLVRLQLELDPRGATPSGFWESLMVRAPPQVTAPDLARTQPTVTPLTAARIEALRTRSRGSPVIVLLLDTLRPSVLGAYGGDPELAPHMDRLADEGVRFDQATAAASFTIASVASLLTGVHTWRHDTWHWTGKLPAALTTWPERFQANGYRTASIVHTPNGSSRFGFDRGFETWVDNWKPKPRADGVLPHLDKILEADDGRPLFLWVHILEPHEPYHPPPPWRDSHDQAYEGTVTGDPSVLWDIRKHVLVPTARDIEHLRAEYADNVAYVDSVVGSLRERLTEAGMWDAALVAVISDHGEGFLEHDGKLHAGMGHGSTVYEEMVRVPMLLRLPAGCETAGTVVEQPVASMDLLATLADLAGVPVKGIGQAAGAVGPRSLVPQLCGAPMGAGRLILTHSLSHEPGRFAPTFGVRQGRWKLVLTVGDPPELYDLETDPGERHDLASTFPVRVGFLRQQLRATGAGAARADVVDMESIDPEVLRDLQALGYLMKSER